jgi:uncharacterized membrane protein
MLNRFLSIFLVILIIGSVGALIYSITSPVDNDKFSEFYILGLNGQAQEYPEEFEMSDNLVTSVKYGDDGPQMAEDRGYITVGIINREKQKASYVIKMIVDGNPVAIYFNEGPIPLLGPLELADGVKWEQKIGFDPQHTGTGQKVELLLYKDGTGEPYRTLELGIDVR